MTERPILFNATMVRAVLAGTKTQTRRVVKPQFAKEAAPVEMPATDPIRGWVVGGHSGIWWCDAAANPDEAMRCPYGKPGDRLWVREAWRVFAAFNKKPPRDITRNELVWYEAQDEVPFHPTAFGRLRPSMFMPRWASRITLEVTGVRVERLRDISEADAMAEGVPSADLASGRECIFPHQGTYRWGFQLLWESINGPSSWGSNPWVWCVSFRRVQP